VAPNTGIATFSGYKLSLGLRKFAGSFEKLCIIRCKKLNFINL